jgi:hypothetical protein
MADRPLPPVECANCGATIPRRAAACPECGADERTGWRDTDATNYDGLDLPDSAYVDEDSTTSSSSSPRARPASPTVNGIRWYWWAVAAVLLLSFILLLLGRR